MPGRLDAKSAVITGGCSGIGLATARRLAAEGARLVIGDLDDARGPDIAAALGGVFLRTDVTDQGEVAALFALAQSSYGSVDIAFNNAGISPPDDDSILTTSLEAWQRVQEVNLTSVYLCCQAALPYMLRAGPRVDHQHRVVRRGDGCGHVADLLHRLQGRRAGHVPRAGRAVRPARASGSTRSALGR